MRKMLILAALAAVTFAGTAGAASVMTSKGTQSLVFQFSGLSDLGVSSYNAGVAPNLDRTGKISDRAGTFGIAGKHYLNDMMAVRPGVELGIASEKNKAQETGTTDEKKSLSSIGISVILEKHLAAPAAPVSPFMGVGAGFGVASFKDEPMRAESPSEGTLLETKTSGSAFSFFGVAGFEVAVMEGVNLGGEYRFGIKASSGKVEASRQGRPTSKVETSEFGLGFATASLFASVAWK